MNLTISVIAAESPARTPGLSSSLPRALARLVPPWTSPRSGPGLVGRRAPRTWRKNISWGVVVSIGSRSDRIWVPFSSRVSITYNRWESDGASRTHVNGGTSRYRPWRSLSAVFLPISGLSRRAESRAIRANYKAPRSRRTSSARSRTRCLTRTRNGKLHAVAARCISCNALHHFQNCSLASRDAQLARMCFGAGKDPRTLADRRRAAGRPSARRATSHDRVVAEAIEPPTKRSARRAF